MKSYRHSAILKLVQERDIPSQGELTEALNAAGYSVAQSTVSRDIRELGLVLERSPKGYKYAASAQRNLDVLLRESLVLVANAGNMMVIKTRPGMAMAVALALDEMEYNELLGCVAGDDTVICVVTTPEDAEELKVKLES